MAAAVMDANAAINGPTFGAGIVKLANAALSNVTLVTTPPIMPDNADRAALNAVIPADPIVIAIMSPIIPAATCGRFAPLVAIVPIPVATAARAVAISNKDNPAII